MPMTTAYTARDYVDAALYLADPIDLGAATAEELAELMADAIRDGFTPGA